MNFNMVYYLSVKNYDEFENLIKSKNLKMSKAVVENILNNLNTKKRFIYVLEITIEDENKMVSLTIGDIFTDKQIKGLEDHVPTNLSEVEWELDEYTRQRLEELGLEKPEKDDELDLISRL